MCTELVPVLHTRENFVPDLHMCDEYLTNSSHVRSYLLEKFEHKSQLQFIEINVAFTPSTICYECHD